MPKRILAKLQQSVLGGAIIIGAASVLSRILGLVRDRLLSMEFGAGAELDAYFTAFKVPDFIFNILVLGVLSASFVPVFIERKRKHSKEDAMSMANSVLNLIGISLVVLAILCYFFAPQLVAILSSGESVAQQVETVKYTRVMLFSLFFFGISNVMAGLLHAHKKFMVYALAPIMYNVGIIFGIIALVPMFGVLGLTYGVVLGSFLHLIVQVPAVAQTGFSYKPLLDFKHPGVIEILKLMPPRALALGLTQINVFISFAIASQVGEGAKTVWQFADNLQHFPINIFGVSLALAAFPAFSEAMADNDMDKFKRCFSDNFRRILFFVIPVSIATLLLRAQIVRLIYGAGEFDWTDTILTAQTLGAFALSMFAQAVIPLLARSFYAKQDTKTPVVVSIIAMVVNIVLALALAPIWGVIGLALAFSIAALLQMVLLLAILRSRHGDLDDEHLIDSTWKILVASLGMGIVIQGLKYIVEPFVDMQTFMGILVQTIAAVAGGGATYLFIASIFKFDEAAAIMKKAKDMWKLVRRLWRA